MGIYTKKMYEALGLEERSKNYFYGKYKGYELTVFVGQQFFVFLNFYGNANVKTEAVKIFQTAVNSTLTMTEPNIYGLRASVSGMTFKSSLTKLVGKLDATIEYLKSKEALGVGYCPCCGELVETPNTVKVNDVYVTLDDKCYAELQESVTVEQQIYNSQPNNYLKGFLGALLGAGIGAVAWVVLYLIGFLSSLTAVLAVFLGDYFYIKFGGKANGIKNVIVAVVSVVVLVLACLGVYVYAVDTLLAEANINMNALDYILKTPDIRASFYSDMAMNVLFTLLGAVCQIFYTRKKDQASKTTISK